MLHSSLYFFLRKDNSFWRTLLCLAHPYNRQVTVPVALCTYNLFSAERSAWTRTEIPYPFLREEDLCTALQQKIMAPWQCDKRKQIIVLQLIFLLGDIRKTSGNRTELADCL